MNEYEIQAALRELYALKARYFRTMDTQDWPGLEAVFAPDLVADFRESSGRFDPSMLKHGAARYVADLAVLLNKVVTVHHGHMPEITLLSAMEACGIWAMEDKLWPAEGSILPFRMMHGYGHYHETYVHLDGGWRIKTIRLTRLRVDVDEPIGT